MESIILYIFRTILFEACNSNSLELVKYLVSLNELNVKIKDISILHKYI